MISGDSNGTTHLWDATTGECLHSRESGGTWVNHVSSVDGGYGLVLARGECVRLWNFATKRGLRMFTPVGNETVQALCLAPDQTTAYAVTGDGELLGWNLQQGTAVPRGGLVLSDRFDDRGAFSMAQVSPDGGTLLVYHGDAQGRLHLLSADSGTTGAFSRILSPGSRRWHGLPTVRAWSSRATTR